MVSSFSNVKRVVASSIGVVALGIALIGNGAPVSAQTSADFAVGDLVVVNTDDLRYRSDASVSADVLEVLVDGTEATITDGPVTVDDYTWYALDINGETGWAAGEYLELATEVTSSESFAVNQVVTVTSDAVNVRDSASVDGEILTTLDTGATATVVSGPESVDGYDWYQVDIEGTTGWVVSDYLTASGSSIPLDAGTTATVNTVDDTLTLRTAAGFDTDIIDYLADGSTVTIVSGPSEVDGYEWYQVSTDLGDGWVAGLYLTGSSGATVSA